MRIVLLGPQGAGKGTQAQRISEKSGAKHISTGDLVRAEIRSGSELGQKIKGYNDRGELVPDEIIISMLRPYLEEADSWILDGFPRNEPQAEALDEMLKEIDAELDAAVALEAPDEALIERLSGRRTSEATGRIYHAIYDPPPENAAEDPGPFVQRKDDTEEAIRRRLKIYHEQTEPLKDYYAGRSILQSVDATQGIADVTEDILRAARPRNRRHPEGHG
jgi:adenylate kinase